MYSTRLTNTAVTELPNETTVDMDLSDSTGMVRLLRQCDAQIFSGWRNYPCLYDEETLRSLENLSKSVQQILKDPLNGCVVFSGCGTSGRIGFSLSKKFNHLANEQGIYGPNFGPYEYLIAGGDLALFTSVELPEDDWRQGQVDLIKLVEGRKKVVYIGITCGLSAPYIAGQLDLCMNNSDVFTPVLIGFNPINLARKAPIEGWSRTFLDIANSMLSHKSAIILNPVVGPEAITGSSRMKGGSATKILLETALLKAHHLSRCSLSSLSTATMLSFYETVYRHTYLLIKEISLAISHAGKSLCQSGHIFYLAWGPSSFMALLDASECIPTFSASFDDVRAFVDGGFEFLKNRERTLVFKGSKLEISLQEFASTFLPSVSVVDTVVALCLSPKYFVQAYELLKQVSQKGAKLVRISTKTDESSVENDLKNLSDVSIVINDGKWKPNEADCFVDSPDVKKLFGECLDELAIKWILNAISTGAHVQRGKVLRNYMIDLKVSNDKLFSRAIGIVSTFAGVTRKDSTHALLRAIYRKDAIPDATLKEVTSCHILAGERQEKVVPLAILLATGEFDVQRGLKTLKERTVSHVLEDIAFQ